jgi:hypothetical protein
VHRTLRWNGKRWALDASFKGRRKETEQGKVYASESTKAHRLTKLFIWLHDVRESARGVEKIRETLWRLISARVISLSNLAAVKKLVKVAADAMKANLVKIKEGIAEVKKTEPGGRGWVYLCWKMYMCVQ